MNKELQLNPCLQIEEMDEEKVEVWLVDFKSSKDIYEDYPAQVWAYKVAWDERFPKHQIDKLGILRMNGETGWCFRQIPPDPVTWRKAMKKAKESGLI